MGLMMVKERRKGGTEGVLVRNTTGDSNTVHGEFRANAFDRKKKRSRCTCTFEVVLKMVELFDF
jgi:hypothetical protein